MSPTRLPGTLHRRPAGDDGVAMLLVMGVSAIITVLSITVATIAVNNLGNTRRDKQAGSAFATSEAGVAAVIERLRGGDIALSSLTCVEPASLTATLPTANCTTAGSPPAGPWSNSEAPVEIPIDGGAGPCTVAQTCFKVWIGTLKAYNPKAGVRTGKYRIHSTGLFGNGPAASTVAVDIEVKPEAFPIGVFGNQVTGNGGTSIFNESLFTRQCVSPRNTGSGNGTRFEGMDVFWDQPASAHSTTMVSSANNCGASGNIHRTSTCSTDAALKNDQSVFGGPQTSGACYRTHQRVDGSFYPDALPTAGCTPRADGLCDSTSFTEADLKRYGYRPRGLSDDQYEALASRARATDTYNVGASSLNSRLSAAVAAGNKQPVVYVDCDEAPGLCPGDVYDLQVTDFPSTFRQPPDATAGALNRCASGPQPVVTLVVAKGSVTFQGGGSAWLDAALFVPDGKWRGNGGYNILGTIFTNDLELGGNEKFQLDACFVRDLPAPLMKIEIQKFSQDDRG